VHYVEYVEEKAGDIEVSRIVFPLAIVLTQDCDLEQDHRFRMDDRQIQDKRLISVLMAPVYNVEHVYQGVHLTDIGIVMEKISKAKTPGEYLRNNDRPRYHYLEFEQGVPIVPSVIDFKHYFSVNVEDLLRVRPLAYVCSVATIFREGIAQRFASYLARVGLPELATTTSTVPAQSPSPSSP
jgi:hypothetical protein